MRGIVLLASAVFLSGCSNLWWMAGPDQGDPKGENEIITIYIDGSSAKN